MPETLEVTAPVAKKVIKIAAPAAKPAAKVVVKKATKATTKKATAEKSGRRSADGVSAEDAPRRVIYFNAEGRALLPKIEAYLAKKDIGIGQLFIMGAAEYMANHK